jgi:hypothetical protein
MSSIKKLTEVKAKLKREAPDDVPPFSTSAAEKTLRDDKGGMRSARARGSGCSRLITSPMITA